MNARVLLLLTLVALSVGCGLLVVATVTAKIRRSQRSRTLERLAAPQRRLVLEVASGEDDEDAAANQLAALPAKEWASIRPAVIAMLSKVRGAPAASLVRVIAAHGEVEAARRALLGRSSLRRARGAHLLGLVRDEESVPTFISLLSDPADDVRFVAARSLGRIGDPSAASAVLASVPGDGSRVGVPAWVAAEALLAMGPDIESALLAGLLYRDPRVRDVAVTVTAHSSLPSTVGMLRSRLTIEPEDDIRVAMIAALGRLGDHEDVARMVEFTDPGEATALRRASVRALGELGDPAAIPTLRELMSDDDRALAALAATSLTQIGGPAFEVLHAARAQGREIGRIASAALHLASLREMAGV